MPFMLPVLVTSRFCLKWEDAIGINSLVASVQALRTTSEGAYLFHEQDVKTLKNDASRSQEGGAYGGEEVDWFETCDSSETKGGAPFDCPCVGE